MKNNDALPARLLPVEVRPDLFAFLVELDQAEWGTGLHRGTGRDYTTVEQIRARVPTNGTRVWTWFNQEQLERAVAGGRFVIVDFWLASVQTRRHAADDGAPDYQAYLDERMAWIRALQAKWGNRVWFCICGEQDNGIRWPETPFASKREGYDYFERAHLTAFNPYPPTKGFEPASVRKMADVDMMRERYGIRDWRREPIAVQIAMGIAAHPAYAWGAGLVWMERNCWLANTQIGIAFMRGAARQYQALWGMDYSSWGDPTSCTCNFKEDGTRAGGISEDLLLREWIATYYAGANSLLAESSAACAWMPDGSGGLKLSPYGENCRKFGRHTLLRHPDRGRPVVPCALMLEKYHGWDPRDHRVWGGAYPYGRGEQMLDNFFNLAFPGQERGFYHDEWNKPGEPPALPYEHNRDSARAAMAQGLDTRPLERGMLVPSTWGDSFDVVLEDCPLDVLQTYPVLLLLGDIRLTPALREKLDAYAAAGGTVVVNVMQADPEHDAWLGVSCDRTRSVTACNFTVSATGRTYDTGYGRFHPVRIVCADDTEPALTLPRTQRPDEHVATCRRIGRGAVYFVGLPYLQTKPDWPIAPMCQELIDNLLRPHLPVDVQGPRRVQFLVSDAGKHVTVTIIHNAADAWTGEIVLQDSSLRAEGAGEIWRNRPLKGITPGDRRIPLKLKPFGFAIVQLQRATG